MIEFPIFNSKDKDSWTLHFLGLAIIIIGLFILFPSINPGVFVIFILAYIFFLKMKKGPLKPIGKVYLNTHQIKIITELNAFEIDLVNLAQVEIIYSGYKGKRMQSDFIGPFNTYSGNDNYIHIINSGASGQISKFKFVVDNKNQENNFMELIKTWELIGYNVSNVRVSR